MDRQTDVGLKCQEPLDYEHIAERETALSRCQNAFRRGVGAAEAHMSKVPFQNVVNKPTSDCIDNVKSELQLKISERHKEEYNSFKPLASRFRQD